MENASQFIREAIEEKLGKKDKLEVLINKLELIINAQPNLDIANEEMQKIADTILNDLINI